MNGGAIHRDRMLEAGVRGEDDTFILRRLKLDGKFSVDYMGLILKGKVWTGEKIFVNELLIVLILI